MLCYNKIGDNMIKKICLCILALVIFTGCGNKNNSDNKISNSATFFDNQIVDGISIENFNVGHDEDGWFISSDVENTLDTVKYIKYIQVKLYNKDNDQIIDTYFYVDKELGVKEKSSFHTSVAGDLSYVKKVEFIVV